MSVQIVGGWLTGSLPDDSGHEWTVVQHRQASARGPLKAGAPNLILHTTETDRYLPSLKYPSQWQCGDGQIGQHIQLGLAGDAVNNWDLYAQQIEMVGRSRVERWLPAEVTLGPVVALVAWLHRQKLIKTGLKRPKLWPVVVDQLPAAVPTYYRRLQGVWPDEPGVYGHIEIPDNSHWDPGGFDYPRFFARVQATLGIGDDMPDDRLDQLQAGTDAFWAAYKLAGKDPGPPPANKPAWFNKGWGNARRGSAFPKPGEPGPHNHNLIGKAE